ncbi:MAG: thioredoxin family protein [Bacteroidetes bacterium]|nr:thioredoxin family protein [Bacteroidota bacterium]
MRLSFLLLALALLSSRAKAQNVAVDSISHQRVLIGPVELSAFQDSSWFKNNYSLYNPAAGLIHQIDSLSSGDSVSVVFGSWCPDSHMWVPMFLSIMSRTALAHRIGFIAVPESPGWRDELTRGLNVKRVPTFIFYHNGTEIGRIVEEPKGDIGENIVDIMKAGMK